MCQKRLPKYNNNICYKGDSFRIFASLISHHNTLDLDLNLDAGVLLRRYQRKILDCYHILCLILIWCQLFTISDVVFSSTWFITCSRIFNLAIWFTIHLSSHSSATSRVAYTGVRVLYWCVGRYTLCLKTSPTFLAITRESIDGFL